MTDIAPAVLVERASKRYGAKQAVDGVSFAVERGEVFALLGPNGAGKTTTVEMLEGYRVPDTGTVRVLGLDPARAGAQVRARMGAMLQSGGMYPQIRVLEAVRLFATFYPHARDPLEILRAVGLDPADRTPYRRLSGGQKQRLALALALVGQPEVLFLDEPTAGMDPQARRATWDLIHELKAGGAAILLTTHYLEEAERLADRVAILSRGRIAVQGAPAELGGSGTALRLRLGKRLDPVCLARLPHATSVRDLGDGAYSLETEDASALLIELAHLLRDAGVVPREIRVGGGALEDLFLEIAGHEAEA